jgi:hypothetical protein
MHIRINEFKKKRKENHWEDHEVACGEPAEPGFMFTSKFWKTASLSGSPPIHEKLSAETSGSAPFQQGGGWLQCHL